MGMARVGQIRSLVAQEAPQPREGKVGVAAALLALALGLANLGNSTGWLWDPSPGPYVALLMGQLGAACSFFVVEFLGVETGKSAA